ncbi:hypothetical protein ACIBU0_35890 [Streptomyces sp. NPDC049627]|uniref:hypothetical protein n=1 Tax=Streptomyces sp. NPDC049627 TaxID=3365595 RepID=UPI0037887589
MSEELLRLLRDITTPVEPQRIAVSIDPSGGGRDVAGVIGGFLGDGRVWVTDDVSAPVSSADWSMAACRLAHRTNASIYTSSGTSAATCVSWRSRRHGRSSRTRGTYPRTC